MLKRAHVFDAGGTRISCLKKWANDKCLDIQKQNKMKKHFRHVRVLYMSTTVILKTEESENFIRKRVLTSKSAKNIRKYIAIS